MCDPELKKQGKDGISLKPRGKNINRSIKNTDFGAVRLKVNVINISYRNYKTRWKFQKRGDIYPPQTQVENQLINNYHILRYQYILDLVGEKIIKVK